MCTYCHGSECVFERNCYQIEPHGQQHSTHKHAAKLLLPFVSLQAGNLKATAEFLPLLNIFWHCWKGTGACPNTTGSDITPPATPTGLTAVSRGPTAVFLRWSSAATNVVEYVISRRTGEPPAFVDRYHTVAPGVRTFLDNAAAANPTATTYNYKVKACNAAGCSAATAEAVVPLAPVGLTATPVEGGKITLSWSPGGAVSSYTGYRLFRRQGTCPEGDPWMMIKAVGATRVTWIDEGLDVGQQYSYKVQGFKAIAGSGGVSRGFSWYSNCASALAA